MPTQEELLKIYPKEQIALNPQLLNTSITSADLTPVTPITPVNPAPIQIPPIQDLQTTATAPIQKETEISDLLKKVTEAQTATLGRTTFGLEKQKEFGFSELQTAQEDIAIQIKGLQLQSQNLQNQAATIPSIIEEKFRGEGATRAGVAPLTAAELRKNQIQQATLASQALILQSSLLASQGKLAAAQRNVDQ